MKKGISIRPSKDIRTNYAKISELSRQNPVAITVNGKEDIVVLCHEDYIDVLKYIQLLEDKNKLYKNILKSLDDIKSGRVIDSEIALKQLLESMDEIKID